MVYHRIPNIVLCAMQKETCCLFILHKKAWGLPWWLCGKEPACRCRKHRRLGFDPWVRKIPWRRKWQTTPVLLPGKSHGQRSLVGYSPQGRKGSDTTEQLHNHSHLILCDPMDCSPPGSSVWQEMLQARILEWVAIPFIRGSSQPMDQTHVSCFAGRFFTI